MRFAVEVPELQLDSIRDAEGILFVGEDHNAQAPRAVIQLIDAFRPEAIALEMRPDIFFTSYLSAFPSVPGPWRERIDAPGIEIAMLYARKSGVPAYLLDWQPTCPSHLPDALRAPPALTPYATLASELERSIDTLFGQGTAGTALGEASDGMIETIARYYRGLEDEAAGITWDILSQSDAGMRLRNEWTALGLSALPQRRILYLGGGMHISAGGIPSLVRQTSYRMSVVPHDLFLAREPVLETSQGKIALPWHLLDYMRCEVPGCPSAKTS